MINTIDWQVDSTLIVTLKPQDYSTGIIQPLDTTGMTDYSVTIYDVQNNAVLTFTDASTGVSTISNNGSGDITITIQPSVIPTTINPCSRYDMVVLANYTNNAQLLARKSIQTYT